MNYGPLQSYKITIALYHTRSPDDFRVQVGKKPANQIQSCFPLNGLLHDVLDV